MSDSPSEKNSQAFLRDRPKPNASASIPDRVSGAGPGSPMAWVPFPVDALPAPLNHFTNAVSKAVVCDPAFVALQALAACASLIGNTRALVMKNSWVVPAALWTVVIGLSGARKTPPWKKVLAPLYAIQKRLMLAHKLDHKKWENSGGNGDKPVEKWIMTQDVTIERLGQILQDNPRGVLVTRDELAGWMGSFTRYGAAGTSDLPDWLQMHGASPLIVHRKTGDRPTLFVERAIVSVTGTTQPAVLARLLQTEHDQSGLTARLLPAMPPKKRKHWTKDDVSAKVTEDYAWTMEQLYALHGAETTDDACEPVLLPLTTEADDRWAQWVDNWYELEFTAPDDQAAILAKLEEAAPRLALIHWVVSRVYACDDDVKPVGVKSLNAGIEMAEWFAREALRFQCMRHESADDADTRRLIDLIQRREPAGMTARELWKSNNRRYESAEAAEAALNALVAAGLAIWRDRPSNARGGRPTKEVVIIT